MFSNEDYPADTPRRGSVRDRGASGGHPGRSGADPDHPPGWIDPLGHGRSDRPSEMAEYSIESLASDAIALLDHLDVDEAVIGGTSLGANVTLEIAHAAPRRVIAP